MFEYKISDWQLDTIDDALRVSQNIRSGIAETSYDRMLKQARLIIEAVKHSKGTEMEPINVPFVQIVT